MLPHFSVSVLYCTEEQLEQITLCSLIPTFLCLCVCCAGVGSTVWHTLFLAVKWCCGCRLLDWPVTRGRHCSTAPVCWKAESSTTSLRTTASKTTTCITVSQRPDKHCNRQMTNAGSGFQSVGHNTDLTFIVTDRLVCVTFHVNWLVYRKKHAITTCAALSNKLHVCKMLGCTRVHRILQKQCKTTRALIKPLAKCIVNKVHRFCLTFHIINCTENSRLPLRYSF